MTDFKIGNLVRINGLFTNHDRTIFALLDFHFIDRDAEIVNLVLLDCHSKWVVVYAWEVRVVYQSLVSIPDEDFSSIFHELTPSLQLEVKKWKKQPIFSQEA